MATKFFGFPMIKFEKKACRIIWKAFVKFYVWQLKVTEKWFWSPYC